jgi:hypothetical protein
MSYIGKEPQFTQYPSKFFNGDGTAMTVTLAYAPPNAAALLVFMEQAVKALMAQQTQMGPQEPQAS